jgi:hypothetical protein
MGEPAHQGDENTIAWLSQINANTGIPGLTLGLEAQLLNWLSIEPNVRVSIENPYNEVFVNIGLGAQIKIPLKWVSHFVIEPYGTFSYWLRKPAVFYDFPHASVGAGIQICGKAGTLGGLFIDFNYMYFFGDAVLETTFGGF